MAEPDILLTLGIDKTALTRFRQEVQQGIGEVSKPVTARAGGVGVERIQKTTRATKDSSKAYAKLRQQIKAVRMNETSLGITHDKISAKMSKTKQIIGLINSYRAKEKNVSKALIAELRKLESTYGKLSAQQARSKQNMSEQAKMQQKLNVLSRQAKSVGITLSQQKSIAGQKIRAYNAYQAKGNKLTQKETKDKKRLETQYRKLNEQMEQTQKRGGKTLASLAKWAVGWSIMYGALRLVANAIRNLIMVYGQLDDAMARVGTVTRTQGRTIKETLETQRKAVLAYGATTRAEFTDVAKAMYFLGSAGLTLGQQMTGFKHVMDLTTGTLANIEETGRLVAGSFNVFGKSIRNAITDSERFKHIADVLAYTFSNQQVELNEIAAAFQLVGSAAGILKIDFDTLVGTIGFLNSGMLKGTRAGTCYDDKTEVLTKDGFKFWKDVKKSDEFATLNPDNHEIEYHKPNRLIKEDYNGKMYVATNKHLDICVTPNHRMYTKSCSKTSPYSYETKTAEEIFGTERTYIRGGKWKGISPKSFVLPGIISNHGRNKEATVIKELEIPMDVWVEFLGYWLSEGHVTRNIDKKCCSAYRIVISQSRNSRHFKRFKKCMDRLPFNFKYYKNGTGFEVGHQQLYSYLKQFGKSYDKYVPSIIKQLSPYLIRIFLDAYNAGDGDNKFRIITSSIRMRDDLEELALKAGYGVQHYRVKYAGQTRKWSKDSKTIITHTKDIWCVSITTRTEFSFRAKRKFNSSNSKIKEEWIDYSGKIYCCEVPNHIVFVRRNGKAIWCLNSLMNSFVKIAQKSSDLTEKLGISFDPSQPLNFVDIMTKLDEKFKGAAFSAKDLKTLMEIFGLRGSRAVANILNRFSAWKKAIDIVDADFGDFAEKMRRQMEDTLPAAIKITGNSLKKDFLDADAVKGFGNFLKDFLNTLNMIRKESGELEQALDFLKDTDYFKGIFKSVTTVDALEESLKKVLKTEKELTLATKKGNLIDQAFFMSKHAAALISVGLSQKELDKLKKLIEQTKALQALGMQDPMREFAVGKREGVLSREKELHEKITQKIKESISGGDTELQIRAKARRVLQESLGLVSGIVGFEEAGVEAFLKSLMLNKDILSTAGQLSDIEERKLATIRATAKYAMLSAKGATKLEVTNAKIADFTAKIADKFSTVRDEVYATLAPLVESGATLEEMYKAAGKYGVSVKHLLELEKLRSERNKELIVQQKEIANIFTNQIEASLMKIIDGTATWKDLLGSITQELLKLQLKKMMESVSTGLFTSEDSKVDKDVSVAGAGGMGAGVTAALTAAGIGAGLLSLKDKPQGESAPGKTLEKITIRRKQAEEVTNTSLKELSGNLKEASGTGSKSMLGGLKGFGKNLSKDLKGTMEKVFPKGQGAMGKGMGIAGGAMQMYQASQGGGGAGGALSGAMGGGMLGMQLGGPVGAAVGAVAGGLLGYFGKKKSEETKHQTVQIASRIDVTNKQLEIVNRNLVDLKRPFEGYIMGRSAYFSEAQAFGLSSIRGYYEG